MYEVVTIGSAIVDQFADTDSELIQIQTSTSSQKLIAFPLGSKLLIRDLNLMIGGGGTNSAVCFARLGFKTAYLGKVGEDSNGDAIINCLKNENVDFIGPREGVSGTSIILNSFANDRTILTFKGANNRLTASELPKFESPWIYLSSMLEQSLDTVVNYLSQSKHRVAFNPSNYQAERGYQAFAQLLNNTDLLIMNKEEACLFMQPQESNPTLKLLFELLSQLPPKLFVITDGAEGAYVCDRNNILHGVPMEDIEVLETTGAGDAFGATFTAAMIKELPVELALHMAMTNSESVLKYQGAKEKLLTLAELDQVVATSQRVIKVREFSN